MSLLSVVRLGPMEDNLSATMLKSAIIDYFAKKDQSGDDTWQIHVSNRSLVTPIYSNRLGFQR